MTRYSEVKLIETIGLVILLAGCGNGNVGQRSAVSTADVGVAKPNGRTIVYTVDITGSYIFAGPAFGTAAREFERNARPNDIWYFRVLTNSSYSDRAAVLSVACPVAPETSGNPFDVEAKRAAQAYGQRFAQLRFAVAGKLRAHSPEPVRGTDVWGALAKAGDLLHAAPDDHERIFVLATDLGDTEGRVVSINLDGVKTSLCLLQSGDDVALSRERVGHWKQVITDAGAASLRLLDPSQTATTDLLALEPTTNGRK